MAKPKSYEFDLKERIARVLKAGLIGDADVLQEKSLTGEEMLLPLPERIRLILGIMRDKPQKSTSMNYLILYDIENNKVRRLIAKYLERKGCIRVQKSVFLCHSEHKKFDEIRESLADINAAYDNTDSIILVPMNISDARSMKLIGKNINISNIIEPPSTIFI